MSAEHYNFSPHLTIRHISDQHHDLLNKIENTQSLVANVPDEADIDISFLQLLESARLYAQSTGKHFALHSPATGALFDALERSGWLQNESPDVRRFWLHEGETQ